MIDPFTLSDVLAMGRRREEQDRQIRAAAADLVATGHGGDNAERIRRIVERDELVCWTSTRVRAADLAALSISGPPKRIAPILSFRWLMPNQRPWYVLAPCEALASRDPR